MEKTTKASPSSLRWSILRRALLPHRLSQDGIVRSPPRISRTIRAQRLTDSLLLFLFSCFLSCLLSDDQSRADVDHVSRRKNGRGFNLIPFEAATQQGDSASSPSTAEARRAVVRYTLPVDGCPRLLLT